VPKVSQSRTAIIIGADGWRKEYFSPSSPYAVIQLIILVAHQSLVEEAHFIEDTTTEGTQVHGIYILLFRGVVKLRTTRSKKGIDGQGYSLSYIAMPHGLHQTANVVGPCFPEISDTLANIVGFKQTMPIHADDDIASCLPDPKVEARWSVKLWIVQQFDPGIP
jgi:hypothetical protein